MKVLVVYEMVPEDSRLYLLDMSPKAFAKYKVLGGKFVNCSDMSEEEQELANELNEGLDEEWKSYRVEGGLVEGTKIDAVILTGWVL